MHDKIYCKQQENVLHYRKKCQMIEKNNVYLIT